MRDAPSIDIVRGLLERGAEVRAYDPVAMAEASTLLPDVALCKDAYEACEGADALVIVTEWNQFRMLDLERVKALLRDAAARRPAQHLRARADARGRASAYVGRRPHEPAARGARLHAVILAGGAGERFWPASRRARPKPFLRVVGRPQPARGDAGPRPALRARPTASGSSAAASTRARCARRAGFRAPRVLVEPERRNTAMAVAWAAHRGSPPRTRMP